MRTTFNAPPLPAFLTRELTGYRRHHVEVGGQRMHVMTVGNGPEHVVMFHGNPTWGYLYRKVVAELDLDRFTVVLPDLIGLGLSTKPREVAFHTLNNHIAWMAAALRALELREVLAVVQDWGGPVGCGALAAVSDTIDLRGIVIMNTVIAPPKPGFKPTWFHRLSRVPLLSDITFRGLGLVESSMNIAQGDRRSITRSARRAYRYPLRGWKNGIAPLALARMVPDTHEHPSIAGLQRGFDFLTRFEGPSAIVWGDKDPVLGSVRSFVERSLPAATVTRTGAGHFLQEEVPDVIAAALVDVSDRASAS